MVRGLSKLDEFTRTLSLPTLRGRWSFFPTLEARGLVASVELSAVRSQRQSVAAAAPTSVVAVPQAQFACRRLSPQSSAEKTPNGLSGVMDQVKKMTTRIDDDSFRRLVRRVGNDLACEGWIRPSRLVPRRRKKAGIGRAACEGRQSKQHGACHTPYDLTAGQTRKPDFHRLCFPGGPGFRG
jgi:hypothetical protein